jgi:hypothetical protein
MTAALAYVATLIANTTRICIALEIQRRSLEVNGLSGNQLHRLEGIVVYFGFLLLLFMLSERMEAAKPRTALLFPLAIYYATTLGIPLLNGSYRQGMPFWEHFIFVLIFPLVLVAILAFFVGAALRGRPWLNLASEGGHGGPPLQMIFVNINERSGGPCGCRSRRTLRRYAGRWCDAG